MSINLVSLLRESARQAPDHIAIVSGEKIFAYAAYKYPRIVEFRRSLPKTATGKLLKRELRAQA